MQYDGYGFSINGQPTITVISTGQPAPFNTVITDSDYAQINALYCGGPTGDGGPGVDPDCIDENKDCAYWASIGECAINPGQYYVTVVKISKHELRLYVGLLQKKLQCLLIPLTIQSPANFESFQCILNTIFYY